MFEDFYEVDSQHGLLEIDLSKYIGMDVGQDIFKINVKNNLLSPTNQVVVIFKGNNDIKKFNAEITLFGSRAEIMIFTESDLDFAKLDVKEFERVLFGDLNFIKEDAFAFPDGSYKNLKYNIDLLYARSAFLFGNNITIGGGEIKELLQLSTHGEKGSVKIKGISAKELFNIKKVKFSPDCLI